MLGYWTWQNRTALGNQKGPIFDFGYGSIGHLQMLARCGAHATAVDVDPLLSELYKMLREHLVRKRSTASRSISFRNDAGRRGWNGI